MLKNIKFRSVVMLTMVLSIICSVYLSTQLFGQPPMELGYADTFSSNSISDRFVFPEVEMLKVVLEKIFDIVTISRL